jgi:hypothetical protein
MVDFKRDTWLYGLLAGILGLVSIIVPWGSIELFGTTVYSWLGGLIQYADGDFAGGQGLQIWTLALVSMTVAAFLLLSIGTWKGKEFKWDWLIYIGGSLVMFLCPILIWVLEGVEDAIPIGGIIMLIAGIIGIIGFVFDKFGDKIFKA